MTLPPRGEVVVRGGWVLSMAEVGNVRDGAVHLRDGAVVAVAPYGELRSALPDVEVIGDGSGIVTPGFVNCHTHLSEALVTGMGSELTLWEWGERIVTPVGAQLTAEDAREGTILKAIELLCSGVTCVNDMFVHTNPGSSASLGVVEGLERVGLRGVVSFGAENTGPMWPTASLHEAGSMWPTASLHEAGPMSSAAFAAQGIEDILAEHEALAAAAAATDLIGFRYGIGTLLGQTDELLAAGVQRCRREGWGVHTHLAEVREEVPAAATRWGRRPVEHACHLGLFERPLIAAHGIWVTEADIALLAAHDVAVAHNPVANMILGSGVCPVPRLRAAGLAIGVGTDGAASNDSQNMLEAIKTAALLQKVHQLDPAVISGDDVLEMATIGGARALGLDDRVGSLEPGKRGDVVLFEGTVETANVHDPVQQLVYATSPRAVSDVWVDGRRLVADHRPTTVDEAAQVARCRPLARRLAGAAGLTAQGVSVL